jgi:hypothetical protein
MLEIIIISVLAAGLIGSITLNVMQHGDLAEKDRMHFASLERLVNRVATEPRLELKPIEAEPAVNPEDHHYISDLPYDDDRWNDYRHEPDEEIDET